MPDFLTHLAAARVPGILIRDPRVQALFIVGTFLPDLAAKGLYWVMAAHAHFTTPTHSILGLVALCYLACLFVEAPLRRPAFFALYGGALLHVALDLFKDNMGSGVGHLFHPLTLYSPEFSLIDPENVVLLVPVDGAILVAAWMWERRLRHVH